MSTLFLTVSLPYCVLSEFYDFTYRNFFWTINPSFLIPNPNSLTFLILSNYRDLFELYRCNKPYILSKQFKPADKTFLLILQNVIILLKAFLSIFVVEFQLKKTHFFSVWFFFPFSTRFLKFCFPQCLVYSDKRQEKSMNIKRHSNVKLYGNKLEKEEKCTEQKEIQFYSMLRSLYAVLLRECVYTEEDTFGACVQNQDTFFASCFILFPNIAKETILFDK